MLVLFVLWTLAVRSFDTAPIGPNGSEVGFSTLNQYMHNLTGVHISLYNITDWLGLVPICFCFGFALLGLVQWISRKSISRVDSDIITLGVFYILVMAVYVFFEFVVINRRPILINGYLEASYPSSTTMLVMCVMPTVIMQFNKRIKRKSVKTCISLILIAFIGFMIVSRFVSGVHWFSDIVGGALISASLVSFYAGFIN